jgi:hypothetical protein
LRGLSTGVDEVTPVREIVTRGQDRVRRSARLGSRRFVDFVGEYQLCWFVGAVVVAGRV